jgi:hypothetical protein
MIPPVVPVPVIPARDSVTARLRIVCSDRKAAHLIWKNALKLDLFCNGEIANNKYTAIVFDSAH